MTISQTGTWLLSRLLPPPNMLENTPMRTSIAATIAKKLATVMISDVPVRDVRELVGEHALDLLRLEALPEAARDGHRRVLRAAAGREGVRDVGVDHRDPRLRQIGHRAEPLDHVVQLGRLLALDDLRPGRRQRELVRREVLEEREPADDQDDREPDPEVEQLEEDDEEDDVEQAEQERRQDHPRRQPCVAAVRLASHRGLGSLEGAFRRL